MANADLTPERLRELLDYDAETGVFAWKAERNQNNAPAGRVAGWVQKVAKYGKPRRCIEVDQKNYKAHRLAWLYVHGVWPSGVIDHINGDSLDNRIANLRDVSQQANTQNVRHASKRTSSGLLGAYWDESRGKWLSSIGVSGKLICLGRFDSAEEAHQAYLMAKRRLHEGCTI